MKIKLPAFFEDIKIGQLMKHGERKLEDADLVRIYAGLSWDEVNELPYVMVKKGADHLREILATPTPKHYKTIRVDEQLHGFIPDWSQLKTKEYVDLTTYAEDVIGNADKIMSILYRPVARQFGDKYDIEDYQGTKGCEKFQDLSASYLYGALVFFWTIRKNYERTLLRSLVKVGKEVIRHKKPSPKDGAGITSSSSWLKETSQRLMRLLSFRSRKS